MSEYHTEGFIKEITVADDKVTFKLEPVAPYIFEKKGDDGTVERRVLFVEDATAVAKLIDGGLSFVGPKAADFHSLIIAKANRMKIRLAANKVTQKSPTIAVTSICVL